MNDIKIFSNQQFGEIRTLEENGKLLFCGIDIAKALGYSNPSKALNDHCKGVTKRYVPTTSGEQGMNFINEGDMYRLITHSKLPDAERFEAWVFDEVLPDIRKHGLYATADTAEAMLNDPDTAIELLKQIKDERQKRAALEARVEQDRPKVLFAEAVSAARTSILIGELAKLLKQNGVDIGQNRLFEWLRNNGYLIQRQGSDFNMPTQRSIEMGLFEIRETAIMHSDGHVSVSRTPKVTGRGQLYFTDRFLSP